MRRKKTQKYLRKDCHYHIKYTAATFLAAFMWRIPLNSVTLATATHRELERVSNGTSTQVEFRMINKWRIKIIQRKIYKVNNSFMERGRKKKQYNNLNHSDILE